LKLQKLPQLVVPETTPTVRRVPSPLNPLPWQKYPKYQLRVVLVKTLMVVTVPLLLHLKPWLLCLPLVALETTLMVVPVL